MGIGLQRGRPFRLADNAVAPAVVIVNQRVAGLFWPGLDPIGKRVRLSGGEWRSVISVCNDVRQDLMRAAAPEFYVPRAQDPVPSMWMGVRTRTDARQFIASLRAELRAIEPGLWVAAPTTIDEVISGYFPGALVAGVGAFCAAALFFAMLGLYGVVSYLVTQRTHEFGVRIALGAGSGDVRRLVLAQGFKLAGAGALIGLAGGFGLARLLAGLLVGVEVTYPLVFVAVAAVGGGTVGLLAARATGDAHLTYGCATVPVAQQRRNRFKDERQHIQNQPLGRVGVPTANVALPGLRRMRQICGLSFHWAADGGARWQPTTSPFYGPDLIRPRTPVAQRCSSAREQSPNSRGG
jgi:hypothetical protein